MQGMIYALGMERMLSPRREVPLLYVMTSYLKNDDESTAMVLESNVSLEIENGAGQIITITRNIKKELVDNRLMFVEFGPALTDQSGTYRNRNFFVSDAGAAQREDGFHRFLEDFLGWQLPMVRRYDGPDSKLYLETIFPLFWVEQKAGWSAIPAAIPTYFRIREVHRRALEFLMDLDVHKLELRRQQILERIEGVARDWGAAWQEIEHFVRRGGGRTEALPQRPTLIPDELERGHIVIAEKEGWALLDSVLAELRERVRALSDAPVPQVGESSDDLIRKLQLLNSEAEGLNRFRIEIHKAKQLKQADVVSLERRIETLAADMQKNQDVQKLQRYAGSLDRLTPDHCPTCEQVLADTLLAQEVSESVMPIEDNIEYLRSQTRMFEDIFRREQEDYRRLDARASQADRDLYEIYAQIRTIRTDLISPSSSPSAVAIEERVRAESRLRELEALESAFDQAMERMRVMMVAYAKLVEELGGLPRDKLSGSDQEKLNILTELLRIRAREFGFSTFDPGELTIDEDAYRPQKEGYEIGFETSASDAIRLKWAYQLGLLELSHSSQTNHPGMLLFDEPRQQSSSKVSFGRLLERAAARQRSDQQIIVSTSEDYETLSRILSEIECSKIIFDGYVIKAIDNSRG